MKSVVKRVHQVSFHRNGITGAGFHAVLFEGQHNGESLGEFVATVFTRPGNVAVLRVPDLLDPKAGVMFGKNSWRGDTFEPELRAAINRADKDGSSGSIGGLFSSIPESAIAETAEQAVQTALKRKLKVKGR